MHNVWQGSFTSDWHGRLSNWELMVIPELGCDHVYVFPASILRVEASQMAGARTLIVKQSGQFEVIPNAQLIIKPD